jgi:hypothetical protein
LAPILFRISILPYLSRRIGDARFEHQEGIRLKSGAVPAAVNSVYFLQLTPLSGLHRDGKAAKNGVSQKTCHSRYNIQSFREKKLGVTKISIQSVISAVLRIVIVLKPFKIIT